MLRHFAVDGVQIGIVQKAGGGDFFTEFVEAIPRGADVFHLILAAIGLGIAFEVAVITVEFDLNQGRPRALAGAFDGFAGSFVHGEEIMAVDDYARHVESAGAIRRIIAGNRIF